jgi:hypothetical protein
MRLLLRKERPLFLLQERFTSIISSGDKSLIYLTMHYRGQCYSLAPNERERQGFNFSTIVGTMGSDREAPTALEPNHWQTVYWLHLVAK